MKRVLYLHPCSGNNLGDLLTLKGSEWLISQALGEHIHYMADLDELEPNPDLVFSKFKDVSIDVLIVSGTPWLWDHCEVSLKYRVLINLLQLFPDTLKIALGIGSCYTSNTLCFNSIKATHIREVWSHFNCIFTRDCLAYSILKLMNLEVYDELDTAVHLKKVWTSPKYSKEEKTQTSLIFYQPELGLAKAGLGLDFINQYNLFQLDFIKRYNPNIYVISPDESSWLKDKSITSEVIPNVSRLLEILVKSKFVVSGRLHSAIPARVLGISTYLMPVDSRALTAVKLNIPLIDVRNSYNFDKTEVSDLNKLDKLISESVFRIITKLHRVFNI